MNYDRKLMVLSLLATIQSLLSSKCADWDHEDFPPFVINLPENATEEYCSLYEKEMDMSRCDFHLRLREWAKKYQVSVSLLKQFLYS